MSADPALLQLADEMVRLYKNLFGRGPASARADYAGPDCVLIRLHDSMTPAETSLVELGEHQRLRDTRLYFQHARAEDFRETVERVLGRTVTGFISGIDVEADVSVEVFILAPQ